MSEFYQFAGLHPCLAFFLAWLLIGGVVRLVRGIFHYAVIAVRGWPPVKVVVAGPESDPDGDLDS